MKRLAVLVLLLGGAAWGQSPAPQAVPWVKVPEVAPPPAPPPAPGSVPRLGAGELYVLDSSEPSFHVSEPDGPLHVAEVPGPVTLYAKFVGGAGDFELKTFAGKKVYIVRAVKAGRGSVIVVKEGAKSAADVFRQQIDANVGPLPPPVPPPPDPGPKPPPPPPPDPPDPAPIPAPGLRVLLIYETAELGKLTAGQRAILYSAKVRAHLDAVCVKGPDGKTAEWRLWDANVDTRGESALWQNAMKRERRSLPWVIISNGKAGFEGPLPDGADAFLELLKRFEGGA